MLFNVGIHKFRDIIGGYTGDVLCEKCEKSIQFTSRTHAKGMIDAAQSASPRYAEGYKVLCESCQKDVLAERNKYYEQESSIQKKRLQELKTMPYQEYLQTPEWQARRKQHLKSVGHRCQICNAGDVPLDIHHRTYERRGQEHYKDLIALCRDCHSTFHQSRKLAG